MQNKTPAMPQATTPTQHIESTLGKFLQTELSKTTIGHLVTQVRIEIDAEHKKIFITRDLNSPTLVSPVINSIHAVINNVCKKFLEKPTNADYLKKIGLSDLEIVFVEPEKLLEQFSENLRKLLNKTPQEWKKKTHTNTIEAKTGKLWTIFFHEIIFTPELKNVFPQISSLPNKNDLLNVFNTCLNDLSATIDKPYKVLQETESTLHHRIQEHAPGAVDIVEVNGEKMLRLSYNQHKSTKPIMWARLGWAQTLTEDALEDYEYEFEKYAECKKKIGLLKQMVLSSESVLKEMPDIPQKILIRTLSVPSNFFDLVSYAGFQILEDKVKCPEALFKEKAEALTKMVEHIKGHLNSEFDEFTADVIQLANQTQPAPDGSVTVCINPEFGVYAKLIPQIPKAQATEERLELTNEIITPSIDNTNKEEVQQPAKPVISSGTTTTTTPTTTPPASASLSLFPGENYSYLTSNSSSNNITAETQKRAQEQIAKEEALEQKRRERAPGTNGGQKLLLTSADATSSGEKIPSLTLKLTPKNGEPVTTKVTIHPKLQNYYFFCEDTFLKDDKRQDFELFQQILLEGNVLSLKKKGKPGIKDYGHDLVIAKKSGKSSNFHVHCVAHPIPGGEGYVVIPHAIISHEEYERLLDSSALTKEKAETARRSISVELVPQHTLSAQPPSNTPRSGK